MEATIFTILFRVPAIIIAITVGVLGYLIYINTRGATKGWIYFSTGAISFMFWAITAILFMVVFPNDALRLFTGALFLGLISIFIPYGYTKLANDFGVKMPSFVKAPYVLGLVIATYTVFVLLNLGKPFTLATFTSLSHMTLGFAMLYACVPTYYLMKQTKVSAWVFAFIFCLVVGLSIQWGQYYSNCCSTELSQSEICKSFDLDYQRMYPGDCIGPVVQSGAFYQLFLLLGIISATISKYKIWQQVRT